MDLQNRKARSLASALVAREQHGQDSRFAGAAANSRALWQRMSMDPKKGLLIGHKGMPVCCIRQACRRQCTRAITRGRGLATSSSSSSSSSAASSTRLAPQPTS
jgi:hypothetical protein